MDLEKWTYKTHLGLCGTFVIFWVSNIIPASVAEFASKVYLINFAVARAVNIVVIALTKLLNTATIITYWKSSQLRKKTSYFLVMLLSIIDLTNGVLGHTSFIAMLIKSFFGDPLRCHMLVTMQLIACYFASLSILTLL